MVFCGEKGVFKFLFLVIIRGCGLWRIHHNIYNKRGNFVFRLQNLEEKKFADSEAKNINFSYHGNLGGTLVIRGRHFIFHNGHIQQKSDFCRDL